MYRVITECRTVSIVKPFENVHRNGVNGEFDQKSIYFKVASRRNYKQNILNKDGSTTRGYQTDFMLVKATGEVAEAFNKNCTAVNGEGKLVSRHLLIEGRLEQYSKPRKVNVQANIGGQLYNIATEVPQNNNDIIVADSITYLDKNPNAQTEAGPAPVVVTPAAAPVGEVYAQVAAQPIQTIAQPVAAVAAAPADFEGMPFA